MYSINARPECNELQVSHAAGHAQRDAHEASCAITHKQPEIRHLAVLSSCDLWKVYGLRQHSLLPQLYVRVQLAPDSLTKAFQLQVHSLVVCALAHLHIQQFSGRAVCMLCNTTSHFASHLGKLNMMQGKALLVPMIEAMQTMRASGHNTSFDSLHRKQWHLAQSHPPAREAACSDNKQQLCLQKHLR